MTDEAKTAVDTQREKLEADARTENAKRSGKGTRVKVGSTRGKNPQPISFENFDQSIPETLPTTFEEFMNVVEKLSPEYKTELVMVSFLIDGFNDAMYTAASDPIAEYVDPSWDDDVQRSFRIIVRQYSVNANISIEDAVNLIKPGIVASQQAKKAAGEQPKA